MPRRSAGRGRRSARQQSASLLVVEQDAATRGSRTPSIDLRVDDHERPIAELRRLFRCTRSCSASTPPEDWLEVDDDLAAELRKRSSARPHGELRQAFADWAGSANLEERVDGVTAHRPDRARRAAQGDRVKVVRIQEIEPIPVVGGELQWRPLRRTLGIEAFGINA
jgi:uncharacterized Ntn-hydrolase superfamily protein